MHWQDFETKPLYDKQNNKWTKGVTILKKL